jgi:hypothetical protein
MSVKLLSQITKLIPDISGIIEEYAFPSFTANSTLRLLWHCKRDPHVYPKRPVIIDNSLIFAEENHLVFLNCDNGKKIKEIHVSGCSMIGKTPDNNLLTSLLTGIYHINLSENPIKRPVKVIDVVSYDIFNKDDSIYVHTLHFLIKFSKNFNEISSTPLSGYRCCVTINDNNEIITLDNEGKISHYDLYGKIVRQFPACISRSVYIWPHTNDILTCSDGKLQVWRDGSNVCCFNIEKIQYVIADERGRLYGVSWSEIFAYEIIENLD